MQSQHQPYPPESMMHGRDWRGEDVAGWFMSEKLHGCRAYWDGAALWSRGGCAVQIPQAWRAQLPAHVALDGEIYAGIGRFMAAQAATVYGRFDAGIRFMVFDADVPGDFLRRQATVRAALAGAQQCAPIEYRCCHSTADALTWLRRIRAAGGEGVMTQHPENVYAAGRTGLILKLTKKSARRTREAAPRTRTRPRRLTTTQPCWRLPHGQKK